MKDQIVFDCETVGSGRGKAIISLAALRFDLADQQHTREVASEMVAQRKVIAEFNGVYFSSNADVIFVKFPLLDSLLMGFEADKTTLEWWGKKSEAHLKENLVLTPIGGICKILGHFDNWINEAKTDINEEIFGWANSPRFDFEMLEEYYKRCNKTFPINFRKECDIRTIRTFFKLPYRAKEELKEIGLESHNPIHDCLIQAFDMQDAYARLVKGSS